MAAAAVPGANTIWVESVAQAVDHMRACARSVAQPTVPDAVREEDAATACHADVVQYLASLWGAETHEVAFMLAT
eukprot:2345199-Prymnesium_polylepis.1